MTTIIDKCMNTTRDKLEVIKHEAKELAQSLKKILEALSGIDSRTTTICGATLENIIDLISEYERRDGKHPMSSESIKEVFGRDRVETTPTLYSQAMPGEIFAVKVQAKVYNSMFLSDVLTDYVGAIFNVDDSIYFKSCKLIAEDRIIFPIKEGMTVEKAASEIAIKIINKHRYIWKAFAAQIFYRSEGYLDVIYGVLEAKTDKIETESLKKTCNDIAGLAFNLHTRLCCTEKKYER